MEFNEIYSIGWNCKHKLECAQNNIKYISNLNNDEIEVIACDKNKKKMVFEKMGNSSINK